MRRLHRERECSVRCHLKTKAQFFCEYWFLENRRISCIIRHMAWKPIFKKVEGEDNSWY
jgi:hypothetical protein